MAECMVTYGRGLDNFVWQEILETIPNANNLRYLGEGKVAFSVCQVASSGETGIPQSQKNVSEEKDVIRGISHEQKDVASSIEHEDTSGTLKDTITGGTQQELNTSSEKVMAPLGTNTYQENLWLAAVSQVFKLKLVERAFILLHCRDTDASTAHQDSEGNSNADDIRRHYENELTRLVGSIEWDNLAVRMRRVREQQHRERRVWCQDSDSCPGSLRKRQVKKELGEKRIAVTFSKHHTADSIKKDHFQKREARGQGRKKRKLTYDCELKSSVESNVCEYENSKMQGITENNVEDNHVNAKRTWELKNAFRNKKQNSLGLHMDVIAEITSICDHGIDASKDSTRSVIFHEFGTSQLDEMFASQVKTNTSEDEVVPSDTKSATERLDTLLENSNSLQNKLLMENNWLPSSPEHISKVSRKNEDFPVTFMGDVSSFRVSSRVSGPHKNILSVKWINHALGQQLSKAMTTWVPDWRQPLVDLYVNVTASHFIVGAALSPRPLSLRPYIPHLTLRSTISHLMARLSQIPSKAIVLDPMCGGGSILLETAMNFDVSHVIGSDSSQEQLEVARCNLHNLKVPVTLLEADAERLPLQDSSINTVLCDFPFGQKYKLTVEGKQLLAAVLMEIQRLLVCGGRAVFLLSPKQHQAIAQLTWDKTKSSSPGNPIGNFLMLLESHLVSLGETSAYIAVLSKEHPFSEPFEELKKGV